MRSRLTGLWQGEQGVAAIEAALILPIMIFFVFASIETYQYFRVLGIMNRAAFSVADAVAMQPKLWKGGPCNLTDHLCTYGVIMRDLMRPIDYAQDGHMAIGVYATKTDNGGAPYWDSKPLWSQDCTGAGSCADTTALDVLPAGMPDPKLNDAVLVVKIFQKYEPFVISGKVWTSLGGKSELTMLAYTRTRFDDLKTLQ